MPASPAAKLEPKRFVDVHTAHGVVKQHYVICTPTNPCAAPEELDRSIPTVLLLHPIYLGISFWQPQFADPRLRRFNVVAVDTLSHGFTVGGVPQGYAPKDAAADLAAFMRTLQLPPCVLYGVCLGTIIALQTAIDFPELVVGLFLVSPIATKEPEDALAGRQQVLDVWQSVFADDAEPDQWKDSQFGCVQLAVNNRTNPLIDAIYDTAVPQVLANWGPEHFGDLERISIDFFAALDFAPDALRGVPITLVEGMDNIAYPPAYFDVFANRLKDAGVPVVVHSVEGAPHYATLTHFPLLNPMCESFVLEHWTGGAVPPAVKTASVESPFDKDLDIASLVDSSDEEIEAA